MSKAAPKRKAANGYKLAEPLPKGEILQDVAKKSWKLGSSIGQGGFGEIYSAQEAGSSGSKYPYVIKIEPHANGPLFVEMHFYMRNAKPDDIEEFKKERRLKTFGMPMYLGSGSHEYNNEKYRFIVMEKFGTDLHKIFEENKKSFPPETVFKLAVQILDVLEYIHSRGYVHADIKGANVLMGITKETANRQVYLVDFGIATKFSVDKEFKPNPKKAHDGTIEYLSRDAHKGVPTRRGDLEVLAYNLIHWLGCTLPWEKKLKDPNVVQKSKEESMETVPKMIKACFGNKTPPGAIVDYLNYLKTLKFNTEPDYKKIRKMFLTGIKEGGDSLDAPFHFAPKKTPVKRRSSLAKGSSPRRKAGRSKNVEEDDDAEPVAKKLSLSSQESDVDEDIIDDSDAEETRVKKVVKKANVKLRQSPRAKKVRKTKRGTVDEDKAKRPAKKDGDKQVNEPADPYEGYTDAMREVMMKKAQAGKSKLQRKKAIDVEPKMDGYTDSMKEMLLKKNERLATTRTLRSKK